MISWSSLRLIGRLRVRILRRAKWRSAARLALIAMVVGPVVALAQVAQRLQLDQLPFRDPASLVAVGVVYTNGSGATNFNLTFADLARVQQQSAVTAGAAGVQSLNFVDHPDVFDVRASGYTLRVRGARVSPSFFDVTGAGASAGRVFTAASDAAADARVVVLSDRLWRNQFGGSAATIGSRLDLGGVPFTVIGVMPPGFAGTDLEPADLWIPWVAAASEIKSPGQVCCTIVARLASGVSGREAARRLSLDLPNKRFVLVPIREQLAQKPLEALRLLSVSAVMVMVLALVALVHADVSAAVVSSRELAILRAYGAPSAALWIGLVIEDLILTALALPISIAASGGVFLLIAPLMFRDGSGWPAASAVGLITVLSAVVCLGVSSIAAAMASRRVSALSNISALTNVHPPQVRTRFARGAALIVAAVLTSLLVVTGVVAAGVLRFSAARLGFVPAHLSVIDMRLSFQQYKTPADVMQMEQSAAAAVRAMPGVESVTVAGAVPMAAPGRIRVSKDGASGARVDMTEYRVEPEFFRELGIPIVEGRVFDRHEARPVAVVSRRCAASLAGGHPIGTALDLSVPTTIVGVAGDIVSRAASWDSCAVFVPSTQEVTWAVRLLVRSGLDRSAAEREFRRAIASVAPTQPVDRVFFLDSVIAEAVAPRRIMGVAVGGLALVAWLVAAIWFHGALATAVADRRRELGLRLAVGGSPGRVAVAMLWHELQPLVIGTALGAAASLAGTNLIRHLLVGLSAPDVPTAMASACLALAAIAASCAHLVVRAARRTPRSLLY